MPIDHSDYLRIELTDFDVENTAGGCTALKYTSKIDKNIYYLISCDSSHRFDLSGRYNDEWIIVSKYRDGEFTEICQDCNNFPSVLCFIYEQEKDLFDETEKQEKRKEFLLSNLTKEFRDFLKTHHLPEYPANEILLCKEEYHLNVYQIEYLENFLSRWEKAENIGII